MTPPRGGKRSGSGRKAKYGGEKTVPRSYTVPESVDAELRRRADRLGKTASELVVEALYRAFKMKPKESPNEPGSDLPPAE